MGGLCAMRTRTACSWVIFMRLEYEFARCAADFATWMWQTGRRSKAASQQRLRRSGPRLCQIARYTRQWPFPASSASLPLMKATSLAFVLIGLLVNPAGADDWPRFRGPNGDGVSGESKVPLQWGPRDNIAWKVELPGHGSSSPIVVGERVLVTCFTGKKAEEIVRHVMCFER